MPSEVPTSNTTSFLVENSSASRQETTQICSPGHKDLGVQPTPVIRTGGLSCQRLLTWHLGQRFTIMLIIFFLQGQASTLPSLEECVNNLPWGDESLFDTSRVNTWNGCSKVLVPTIGAQFRTETRMKKRVSLLECSSPVSFLWPLQLLPCLCSSTDRARSNYRNLQPTRAIARGCGQHLRRPPDPKGHCLLDGMSIILDAMLKPAP